MSRYRSEVLTNVSGAYSMSSILTRPLGTCTEAPGPYSLPWNLAASGSQVTDYKKREMTDVITPGFHRTKAQGGIINSPMSKLYTEYHIDIPSVYLKYDIEMYGCSPARWYHWQSAKNEGTVSLEYLFGANLFKVAPTHTTSLKDQAVNGAWDEMSHAEIYSLATLKEFPSTIEGMRDLLVKVVRIYTALKSKKKKLLKKAFHPRELADLYMNARYNLRPLYYDMKGLVNALTHSERYIPRQTFRSRKQETLKNTDIINVPYFSHAQYVNGKIYLTRTVTSKRIVRAGVLADVLPATQGQIFGLESLLETMWDLIPFSFIIDWFYDVGTTIGAWTPDYGFNVLASWVTTETIVTYQSYISDRVLTIVNDSTYHFTNSQFNIAGAAEKVVITKTRDPEPYRAILPSFRLKLNPLKILDLAIIASKLKNPSYVRNGA